MLQREEFLLFAAGFSLSLMIKQSITLFVEFKKQNILNLIMLLSWTLYILVQGSNAWNILYRKPVMDPKFLAVSTILYTITIVSTLYISIVRVIALNCNGLKTMTRSVKLIMFPLLLILTFIRCVRTALLITQGSNINSSPSPIISELQLASIVPILLLRVLFDSLSLLSLFNISKNFVKSNDRARTSIMTISISLVFEVCVSIISIVVAVLETIKYQGDCIAFQDWWLIAWSIASSIEQRSHYISIFAFVGDSLNPGSSLSKSLSRSNSRLSPTERESVSSLKTLAFSKGTTSLSPLRSASSNSDFSNYARFERV